MTENDRVDRLATVSDSVDINIHEEPRYNKIYIYSLGSTILIFFNCHRCVPGEALTEMKFNYDVS